MCGAGRRATQMGSLRDTWNWASVKGEQRVNFYAEVRLGSQMYGTVGFRRQGSSSPIDSCLSQRQVAEARRLGGTCLWVTEKRPVWPSVLPAAVSLKSERIYGCLH